MSVDGFPEQCEGAAFLLAGRFFDGTGQSLHFVPDLLGRQDSHAGCQDGRFEDAAAKFREAGKLGLRERSLGPLLTLALFKAGQRLLYAAR